MGFPWNYPILNMSEEIVDPYKAPNLLIAHFANQVRQPCFSQNSPWLRSQPDALGRPSRWTRTCLSVG